MNIDDFQKEAPKAELSPEQELYWEDYEYEYRTKTSDWYWIVGTIAFLTILISVILGNFLLAIIIFLGSFILGAHALKEPLLITYGLSKNGIKYGNTIFPYSTIHSFWIDKNKKSLIIQSERMIKPNIYIPLGETDPEEVQKTLSLFIKEKEYHGSLPDIITEFFNF